MRKLVVEEDEDSADEVEEIHTKNAAPPAKAAVPPCP